jgi:hypothetical protein
MLLSIMIFHFFIIKQNSRKGCRYSRWTYFFTTPPDIPIRLELKDYIIDWFHFISS